MPTSKVRLLVSVTGVGPSATRLRIGKSALVPVVVRAQIPAYFATVGTEAVRVTLAVAVAPETTTPSPFDS